ncbi:hypothetical protein CEXT_677171 [Caerostris extrusa]|uniref:Uncharacterized protein n=1 Tax=Caerostris extrusa TaxID=172846 RepID=A0AAV4NJY6_CAEEX|nr:hypothetical protein CEXT_677171 [Caerostris extrusa]
MLPWLSYTIEGLIKQFGDGLVRLSTALRNLPQLYASSASVTPIPQSHLPRGVAEAAQQGFDGYGPVLHLSSCLPSVCSKENVDSFRMISYWFEYSRQNGLLMGRKLPNFYKIQLPSDWSAQDTRASHDYFYCNRILKEKSRDSLNPQVFY